MKPIVVTWKAFPFHQWMIPLLYYCCCWHTAKHNYYPHYCCYYVVKPEKTLNASICALIPRLMKDEQALTNHFHFLLILRYPYPSSHHCSGAHDECEFKSWDTKKTNTDFTSLLLFFVCKKCTYIKPFGINYIIISRIIICCRRIVVLLLHWKKPERILLATLLTR